MITSADIKDWKDLQAQVGRILQECGFSVEVEKIISTPRGEVEVDVFAVEDISGRAYKIICECKNWQAPIPQTVVHAFRTVVSEVGANIGYIISKAGFQSGSYSSSEMTNLRLLTWHEFQDIFEESWLKEFFSPYIYKRLDPLLTYTEPLLPIWFHKLSDENQERYLNLRDIHMPFGALVMLFSPFMRKMQKLPYPALPLIKNVSNHPDVVQNVPENILNISSYRELLEQCIIHGEKIISEFREIRSTVVSEPVPHQ